MKIHRKAEGRYVVS